MFSVISVDFVSGYFIFISCDRNSTNVDLLGFMSFVFQLTYMIFLMCSLCIKDKLFGLVNVSLLMQKCSE